MKSTAILAFAGAVSAADFLGGATWNVEAEYLKYIAKYNKNYLSTEEYELRLGQFAKSHYAIDKQNAKGESLKLSHNHMSDWTEQEYKATLGYKSMNVNGVQSNIQPASVPASVDWRESLQSMKVTKNQGQCGSCWAFSTIGSVESHSEQKFGNYVSLSEQQLVDCAPYTLGCSGGNYFMGFTYLQDKGSQAETTYPYKAADGPRCAYDNSKVVNHHVSGWNIVTPGSTEQLKNHIAQGPVSVAIEADQSAFQLYQSGVLKIKDCGLALDHAVLAIGYGTEDGVDYFLIRNSWGANWGDNGTIKLEYNAKECACGCATEPAFVQTNKA
jgi:C1A family cysteine protease